MSNWWDGINISTDTSDNTSTEDWLFKSLFQRLCSEGRALHKIQFMGYVADENVPKLKAIAADYNFKLLTSNIDEDWETSHGHKVYVNAKGAIGINEYDSNRFALSVSLTNEATVRAICKKFKQIVVDVAPTGTVKMLGVNVNGGYHLMDLGHINAPFQDYNYTPDIRAAYEHIVSELGVNVPCGRLILLHGDPGTGKSFFIRALVSTSEAMFVFIPSSLIGSLSGPQLATCLIKNKVDNLPIVLILEDADMSLQRRSEMNLPQLSDLLNIGDGLMGELADIRLVATTNAPTGNVDKALKRPGRMCREVEFKATQNAHAKRIYKKLTNEKLSHVGEVTLAELYKMIREKGWSPQNSYTFSKSGNPDRYGDYI